MGIFSGVKDFFTGSESADDAKSLGKQNVKMVKLEAEEEIRRRQLGFDISQGAGIAGVGASGVNMQGSPEMARAAAEREFVAEQAWVTRAAKQREKVVRKSTNAAVTSARLGGISRSIGLATSVAGFF